MAATKKSLSYNAHAGSPLSSCLCTCTTLHFVPTKPLLKFPLDLSHVQRLQSVMTPCWQTAVHCVDVAGPNGGNLQKDPFGKTQSLQYYTLNYLSLMLWLSIMLWSSKLPSGKTCASLPIFLIRVYLFLSAYWENVN